MPKRRKKPKKVRREELRLYRIRAIRLLALMVVMVGIIGFVEYRIKAITTVDNLTLNYQKDPAGVRTEDELVFGWKLNSEKRTAVQDMYCINVYEGSERGRLVWSSGEVKSSESALVRESSLGLENEKKYVWTVTVEVQGGWKVTSRPAQFITETDFSDTSWIIPDQGGINEGSPLLRTEQKLKNVRIEGAFLYVSAMGAYNAYINGERVLGTDGTEYLLAPGWTDYNSYVNYQTYDVTDMIGGRFRNGKVVLGIELGNGWYAGRIGSQAGYESAFGPNDSANELGAIARLVVRYADGSVQVIRTEEENWYSSTDSPTRSNDLYGGEIYDGVVILRNDGWNEPDYKMAVATWSGVQEGEYRGELRSSGAGLVRVATELTREPVSAYTYNESENDTPAISGADFGAVVPHEVDLTEDITLTTGDKLIVDFGQVASGSVDMTVSGGPGTMITIRHANMLNDGMDRKIDTQITPDEEMLAEEEEEVIGRSSEDEQYESDESDADNSSDNSSAGSDTSVDSSEKELEAYLKSLLAAEEIDTTGPRGSLYIGDYGTADATDVYRIGSNEDERYRSVFTYQGFRYAEISADADITIRKLTAATYTSLGSRTGWIETDNEQLNQLFENAAWSQLSSSLSVPVDSPQGDSRTAFTADAEVFSVTGLYNFDSFAFYKNYVDILAGSEKGIEAPTVNAAINKMKAAGYGDAVIIIPWQFYQQTGSTALIEEYFDEMDSYMDTISAQGYDTGILAERLGIRGASLQCVNEIYRLYTSLIMQLMARQSGNGIKLAKYQQMFNEGRMAFIEKYVDDRGNIKSSSADGVTRSADGSAISDNSQTAIIWALKLSLFNTAEQRDHMLGLISADYRNMNSAMRTGEPENSLTIGITDLHILLPVLSDYGQTDLAYEILLRSGENSWMNEVEQGATTIWSRGDAYTEKGGFNENGKLSFNSYAQGAFVEWMYRYMAGITQNSSEPGFQKILLQPLVDGQARINHVKGSYDSLYGTIVSEWNAEGGQMAKYKCSIPINTEAVLYLPITEQQATGLKLPKGASYVEMEARNGRMCAKFTLIPGEYTFTIME